MCVYIYICIYTYIHIDEYIYVCNIYIYIYIHILKFPRRDSKPNKRLQEHRAIPCVLLS